MDKMMWLNNAIGFYLKGGKLVNCVKKCIFMASELQNVFVFVFIWHEDTLLPSGTDGRVPAVLCH